ncbi:DUF4249 domain-containing protein [Dysgonomonas sp. Marseille-P4361]|uniref:DUF4249 domain-containing protein n=1 Tax=Dysgonomonas sp. Marseille-P4361 TaxID=2161820 RepID=UPI000D550DD6|nr:DUF4249 domain-containing protein [Dysgonomonas sp. Marseille-P4361]
MKSLYKLLLLFSAIFLFASCEKEVTLDLKSAEPRLVIDASISDHTPCVVTLSLTQSFYDNDSYDRVSGATVILYDEGMNSEVLEEVGSGYYQSKEPGVVGVTYFLKVIVDSETYEAEATIPHPVSLDETWIYEVKAGDKSWYSPSVIFNDPKGEKNYYYTKLSINEKPLRTVYLHNDENRDGKRVHRILFFNKEDNDDKNLETGDQIDIEMQSIDYGMYEFLRSWTSFSGGDANPTTNFSGDVLGCFKAYSSSWISMIVSTDNIYQENI